MAAVKKYVFFSLPAGLLAFILFQNFAPLIYNTSTVGYQAIAAPVASAAPVKKPEPLIDIKSLKQGIYYAFKADYNCLNLKNPKAPPVPSHLDSYGIADGKICHLGDVCNSAYTCSAKLPAGMTLTRDSQSLQLRGREFRWQESPNNRAIP